MKRGRRRHPDRLTPAEWRVANAVRHGMSNGQIGRRFRVSLDAVKYHVANAVGKLGLASRQELKHWSGAPAGSALHARTSTMTQAAPVGAIRQISRKVRDIGAAVAWYRDVLELPHLFTFGSLAFFDCHGVRLMLSSESEGGQTAGDSVIYFSTADIQASYQLLQSRGVSFRGAPHMVHRHQSGDEEWMAFFEDVDGQLLALASLVTSARP